MKALKPALLIIAIILVISTLSFAEIPHTINYQGKLTDASGKPVSDGTYSVSFRIYDQQAGGSPLWYETQSVTTQKGLFDTQIGATKDLDLVFDNPYYLGIKVGTDSEMTPRQALSSSAYAFRAKTAENAEEAKHSLAANSASTINGIGPESTNLKPFGAWAFKNNNRVYQAATDGFIICDGSGGAISTLYSDSNNPPTTVRASMCFSVGDGVITCPIRKNDYYKFIGCDGGWWMPMGREE